MFWKFHNDNPDNISCYYVGYVSLKDSFAISKHSEARRSIVMLYTFIKPYLKSPPYLDELTFRS